MASLSRARFALPTQLAATFRFSRRFALCLPPAGAAGVVVFGDAPYAFQPGLVLSNASLIYTPLLVNPVSTAGVSAKGDKSDEYFVGVTGIKVNGRAVPLNATLLAIDKKGGEVALWSRRILMGERCQPLDFAGAIHYDSFGGGR